MLTIHKFLFFFAAVLAVFLLVNEGSAQNSPAAATADVATAAKAADLPNYRFLQSDEFLVETAYLQDEPEFLHKLTFSRANHRAWSADFTEELTIGSEKHQFVFSVPVHLAGSGYERARGLGDAQIEYSYGLFGNSSSRVTVSPGAGLTVPIGNPTRGLGAGGPGLSFKMPVSIVLTSRVASNSIFELNYTKSARNSDGERANTIAYEVGQSFVWFAKPKVNFFVETLWERSQEITGRGLTVNEYSLVISPAVRWAYEFRNGFTVSPGVAMPIGIGPSHGENNIFFYIAFGHPVRKGQD